MPLVVQDLYASWLEAGGSDVEAAYRAARAGRPGELKTGISGALPYLPAVPGVAVRQAPGRRSLGPDPRSGEVGDPGESSGRAGR